MHLDAYLEQQQRWPKQGRHVLAHFDDDSIVVYQAFRPQIADEAVRLGRFGPSFLRSRMSWIKPNFLWMMYRCGWATKVDQERVLAVRLPRPFFDRLLALAVSSWFDPAAGLTEAEWSRAVASSDVRLQWDPDHNPGGSPLARRAVRLEPLELRPGGWAEGARRPPRRASVPLRNTACVGKGRAGAIRADAHVLGPLVLALDRTPAPRASESCAPDARQARMPVPREPLRRGRELGATA